VRFRPASAALRNGMRPDLLIEELRCLGSCRLTCHTSDLPELEQMDPTESYLGWTVHLTTDQPRTAIEAVFIFAEDADLSIDQLAGPMEPLPDLGAGQTPESAPRAASSGNAVHRTPAVSTQETVRVPSAKLDSILDQLGELVIAQARLTQIAGRIGDATLDGLVEEIYRLVTTMRDTTLAVRMLPIETVFGKFRRVVRDLSTELGKDVILETDGGETEIDKNVLDRLSEPLVHMIRNAIDHGIEDTAGRLAAGKSPQGRVRLSAWQDAGEILIQIRDDGKGLDFARIRERAVAQGLILSDAPTSDGALAQLIFAPGFSTAETVSTISGRGVGMDAVLTTITALRGSVGVTSPKGEGTRITLRLPPTLSIIEGLLVTLGQETFVIPLTAVEECAEFDVVELARESGRTMLRIRDHLVPFVDLADSFGDLTTHVGSRRVVIVRAEGERMGLVVDDILGQHHTVIKPMSAFHAGLEDFAGSTILADGTVALILDVALLLRRLSGRHDLGLAA
jgi:two-component system chemotaxis sensor kinase CheA